MKNTKEEKSKKQHKKPEPLNVEARWGKLFSVPMLHITVPELYIKDLIDIEPGADARGSSIGKGELFLA